MTGQGRPRATSSGPERPDGRARPVVLAAPSGTGKTTIARRLVSEWPEFTFSVSATTRPPREGERDGTDYDFLDEPAFRRMVDAGGLVEWAEVHGHLYGTPRRNIEVAAEQGVHVVLDIDVQGARQIRQAVPDALRIFVLPPSAEALVARLSGRGTEAHREMVRRLRNARGELLAAPEFDAVVVNDDLERAVSRVRALVLEEAADDGRSGRGESGPPAPEGEELRAIIRRLRREIDQVLERGPPDGSDAPAALNVR